MKTSMALAIFSLAVMFLVPPRVIASTVTDCQLLIVSLTEETTATAFLRGDKGVKTELQLLHHLSNASTELDQLDFRSAIKEIGNFETDVDRAVTAVVLSPADGTALNVSADSVVSCIQQIAP